MTSKESELEVKTVVAVIGELDGKTAGSLVPGPNITEEDHCFEVSLVERVASSTTDGDVERTTAEGDGE